MKNLYEFYFDCGRMGSLEGLFLSTDRKVNSILGQEIYFGEVLGKHSEVYGTIEKNQIKKLDAPEDVIKWLDETFGNTVSGYNPFDYLDDGSGV